MMTIIRVLPKRAAANLAQPIGLARAASPSNLAASAIAASWRMTGHGAFCTYVGNGRCVENGRPLNSGNTARVGDDATRLRPLELAAICRSDRGEADRIVQALSVRGSGSSE